MAVPGETLEQTGAQPRRVLITGLATHWGGRLARALEANDGIEAIVGVDTREPTLELERTEFVKISNEHALIWRIIEAVGVDTVLDTRLTVDSASTDPHEAHENNVIGTLNILAGCSGPDSPVRKLVFKSSAHYYGCGSEDPAFFEEGMPRQHAPPTDLERDVVDAEAAVADFSARSPGVEVAVLRCANVLGSGVETSHTRLLGLPVVPMMAGFDPRYQFVHEDDVVRALEHATFGPLRGVYNLAADGVLGLSEVASLLGKLPAPVIPPWGGALAAAPLRALGIRLPEELRNQLRYGRGLDNRLLKSTGFNYAYTTRETVLAFAERQRMAPLMADEQASYHYQREVEEFLRRSLLARGKRDV